MSTLLTEKEIYAGLKDLHEDWSVQPEQQAIERRFRFDNFLQGIAFVNSVAWIAEQQDHHPDLHVGYATCLVHYTSHSAGGLTELDFAAAAAVDQLLDA